MNDLEIDGPCAEQRFVLRKARQICKANQGDLKANIDIHSCKKGIFCPVKVSSLSFDKNFNEHALKFEIPPGVVNMSYVIQYGQSVSVNIVNKGFKGSISCSCQEPDCMQTLLKTLCNISVFKT
ncbi:E3 14.7K [Egyptian fruit bat adenovirus]|uniref:E3 14.7K n=1 Tax=Egyptian fruit bat adenovirus TaxID=2849732 RepID=A0A344X9V6_9ADEN|nr:E3 14.7K [Rousettus aegyptiacus adenovirus]AXE75638.1 E3 14.7K [Egyptian fruit bat adenovirus]